jgi:hypothetical protein
MFLGRSGRTQREARGLAVAIAEPPEDRQRIGSEDRGVFRPSVEGCDGR